MDEELLNSYRDLGLAVKQMQEALKKASPAEKLLLFPIVNQGLELKASLMTFCANRALSTI